MVHQTPSRLQQPEMIRIAADGSMHRSEVSTDEKHLQVSEMPQCLNQDLQMLCCVNHINLVDTGCS
ncbi:hypothetical protein Hamer_G000116 [Homarus americanus]|uniref:Uncharacterized protein n=1 Tax=Homarus americanus TaxID=6706 RepID=A0A8J5TTP1_HOMAM|nr:hypothetical protein Hamer_G000116 [Homarus americanus]